MLAWTAALALATSLAGCGNERGRPAGLARPGKPAELINYSSASGDVSFGHPSTWTVVEGRLPEVARLASGSAVATIYAYPRTDLPEGPVGAENSRRRLLESLHRRAPSFQVESSRTTEIDDAPAVEILGRGRIAGEAVKTRSVHVYKGAAEYVIDAYARPAAFGRADRNAFRPLLATVRLGGRAEASEATNG